MDLCGKKFWTYRIERVLGTGGTATVYAAVDERDGKSVAIKILPEGIDRSQLQRFKQETKVLSQLDHPHIIKIHDIGSAEGLHFYVMENREWRTLRELMDERFAKGESAQRAGLGLTAPGAGGPSFKTVRAPGESELRSAGTLADGGKHGFTIDEILTLARDVTDALACSHSRRIYHRDIKPSNILITPDFRSVLCDFGLAKVSDDKTLTQVGTLMGTPLYMSPEQLQGGEVDGRSDVYQLGLVLYQMATRHVPFAGDNPYVAATRRLHEAIPPPSGQRTDLPGGLEQILMRCVERDRTRRFQSAAALLEHIERLSVSLKRMKADGDWDHTVVRPRARGRGWLPAATGTVALLAAALGGWAFVSGTGTEIRIREFSLIPGRQEATLSFSTDRPLRSEVIFGDTEELDRRRVLSAEPSPHHRANLVGLTPGRRYVYRIRLILESDRMKELPARDFTTTAGP